MVYNDLHCPTRMRKEILLAIVIGLIVGLGITFGLYTLRQNLIQRDTASKLDGNRTNTDATPTPNMTLTLTEPKPDLYTTDASLQVTGKALPHSYIVVLAQGNEAITTADQDGDFSVRVTLAAGGNKLTVIATTPEGKQEQLITSVVYSTANLDDTGATTSANPGSR